MRLEQGDVIKRPGPLGSTHVGLYAGMDQSGREWVIHNAKDDCVKWDLLETFAAGNPISLGGRAANFYEGAAIIARAVSLLGRKFDLINFNCEHFVSYAPGGQAISPQLRTVVFGAALLASIGVLANSSS